MVDIHSHLLPDYDDGPPTLDDTRRMLELAEKTGTTEIVATPHLLDESDYARKQEILDKFALVKEAAKRDGRKLKIYLGGEVFLFPGVELNEEFSTLNNNGRYALVEFGMRQIPEFVPQKLFDWIMDGYRPILAHPERYLPVIKNPRYAYKFAQMGVALQINAGSLLGVFGESVKETAHLMLRHKLAHIIASDGHNTGSRSISLGEVRDLVEEQYGEELARILLEENPRRAVRGEELLKEEPLPLENDSGKPSRWELIKRRFGVGRKGVR